MLSEYEQLRLNNIKRNEDFLKQMGLNDSLTGFKKDAVKQRKTVTKRIPQKSKTEIVPLIAERRSKRLSHIPAETPDPISDESFENFEPKKGRYETDELYEIDEIELDSVVIYDDDGIKNVPSSEYLVSYIIASSPEHYERLSDAVSFLFLFFINHLITLNEIIFVFKIFNFFLTFKAIAHCLHRMKTMSNKALSTRLKKIAKYF
jgi:hypothetical protein